MYVVTWGMYVNQKSKPNTTKPMNVIDAHVRVLPIGENNNYLPFKDLFAFENNWSVFHYCFAYFYTFWCFQFLRSIYTYLYWLKKKCIQTKHKRILCTYLCFSRRRDNVLRLLGTISCTTIALRLSNVVLWRYKWMVASIEWVSLLFQYNR